METVRQATFTRASQGRSIGDGKLTSDDAELQQLRAAVGAQPDSVDLRLRLATALAHRDYHSEALEHCTAALGRDPGNSEAVTLLRQISAALEVAFLSLARAINITGADYAIDGGMLRSIA
ncbi:MAG: tetratricopeptide repeat protein [Mycobacteriales bacterium]